MRARSGIPRLAGLTLTVIGNSRAGVPRIFPTVRPVSGTRFASEKGPFGRDVAAAQRISEGTTFGGQMRARAYSLHHNGYDETEPKRWRGLEAGHRAKHVEDQLPRCGRGVHRRIEHLQRDTLPAQFAVQKKPVFGWARIFLAAYVQGYHCTAPSRSKKLLRDRSDQPEPGSAGLYSVVAPSREAIRFEIAHQASRADQVAGVEPLGEFSVCRRQQATRLCPWPQTPPQLREAHGGAEFP